MKETNIQQLVRLEASKHGAVLWRNNTGGLYDKNGRWVNFGLCQGSADLIGIYNGLFVAIEVKTPKGKLKPEQLKFLELVRNNGGVAGVARQPDDTKKILDGVLTY